MAYAAKNVTKGSLRFPLQGYRLRLRPSSMSSYPPLPPTSHSRFSAWLPAPESFSPCMRSLFPPFPAEYVCLARCFRGRGFNRSVSSPSAARSITMCLPKLTAYASPASSRMMKPSSWRAFRTENTFSSWKISCRRLTASVWDCGLPPDNSTRSGRLTLNILQSRSRSASVVGWNISINRMRLWLPPGTALTGVSVRRSG